jgi:hypothetical protein
MISTIVAVWNVFTWLRRQRREMEANAEAYLTEERAKAWRIKTETIFKSLSDGNGDFKKLPKPVQWFFAHTKADNRLGQFGQWFLKSSRLDIYRTH